MKYLAVLMIICAIILVVLYINKKPRVEAFQQSEKFVVRTNADIYDEFYSEIYDELMVPEQRVNYEADLIINTIQPNKTFTKILDVGAGTGTLVDTLSKRGYMVTGVDRSASMVDKAVCPIIRGDVLDPMLFDRGSFNIILCLDFTIYEMSDKRGFFKNAFYWLEKHGYLVVHLADKDRFNAITPGAKPVVLDTVEQLGPERIKKTEIDFGDFTYSSDYVYGKGCQVCHKETFVDKASQNVRQNELTLYMEGVDEIIDLAVKSGFTVKGGFSLANGPLRDAAQQIIIFERV
jgi:SAM-dependent methyltransferase